MRFCNCRRVGSGEETGPATLTGNHNPGLSLTWTEITRGARGAPLLALSEKGPAEPPGALIAYSASSAPSPPPPPSPAQPLAPPQHHTPPPRQACIVPGASPSSPALSNLAACDRFLRSRSSPSRVIASSSGSGPSSEK